MPSTIRWIAGIAAILVLVQAMLIGQSLFFGEPAKQSLHGWIGSVALIASLLLAIATVAAVRRGEMPAAALALSLLVVLLMVAQLGLGYVGRRGGWAAALHIPNGVLILGVLSSLFTVSFLPRSAASRARA